MAVRSVVCAVAALAFSFPLAAQADRTLVIRLASVSTSVTPHDVAPAGFSPGDRYVATSRLLNVVAQFGKPKGAVVGSDRGTLFVLSATTGRAVGVAKLPGGTISFRGRDSPGARSTVPVVGGTGDFAHARGTLVIATVGNTTFNTYTLKLPGSA